MKEKDRLALVNKLKVITLEEYKKEFPNGLGFKLLQELYPHGMKGDEFPGIFSDFHIAHDAVEKALEYIKPGEGIVVSEEYPPIVGLFWFKEDYSDIDELVGHINFTDGDVVAKRTILPEGSHSTYKARTRKLPRGRVELNDGVVTITVGEKCPDSAIDKIIGFMGLELYKEGIRVIRASYWDDL